MARLRCTVSIRHCTWLSFLLLILSLPAVILAFSSSASLSSDSLRNMSTSKEDETSNDSYSTAIKPNVRVLGVCGGIGSGKSKACELLVSELGCISHIGKTRSVPTLCLDTTSRLR